MDSLQVQSTQTILTALMVTFVILLVTVGAEAQWPYVPLPPFTLQPVSVIQAEGLEAIFKCGYPGAYLYHLQVNDTDVDFFITVDNSPAVLTFTASPEYNNTVVLCLAIIATQSFYPQVRVSDQVTITVQGPLEAVSGLDISRSVSCILISWIAPFSLDLTTAEPDIVYCVDIYNVTGGETEQIVTKCDITDTSYLFSSDNLSPDHIFNLTVTPMSNVPGSKNGTSSQVQVSTFRRQSNTFNSVEFKSNIYLNPMTFTYSTESFADACMPTSYTLVFKNVTGFSANCSANPTVTNNNTSLTFTNSYCTHEIERHRLYNVTIIETYTGSIAMFNDDISTHDVQSPIITNSSQPGQINISTNYLEGSTDEGVFCLIYSLGDSSHVFYGATFKEMSKDFAITSLPQAEYMVVLYDLEEDSLPRETPAALTQHVPIANNMEVTTTPNMLGDLFNATSPKGGEIYIICSFTDCVGVIHSMNMDNLTLHHFRNGDRVSELKKGNYSVVLIMPSTGLNVFSFYSTMVYVDSPQATSESTTTSDSVTPQNTAESVVGIGVGVVVITAIVTAILVTAFCVCRKNKAKSIESESKTALN